MEAIKQISSKSAIHTIMELLMKIQNNGLGQVFFEYSGHVNSIGIRVYKNGWSVNEAPDFVAEHIYVNNDNNQAIGKIIKNLKRFEKQLSQGKMNSIAIKYQYELAS